MSRRSTVLAMSICVASCGGSNGALLYGGSSNSGGAGGSTHGNPSGGSLSGGAAGNSGASDGGSGGDEATASSSGGFATFDAGLGAAGGDVGTATGGRDGGADRDAGTSGATPMAISCGTSTCTITTGLTDVCCALPLSFPPFPTGCFPSFPGCVTTGVPFACDDAADCASGNICCGSTAGTGCAPSCSSGSAQFCRTNDECSHGTCHPWSTAKEYSTCQ